MIHAHKLEHKNSDTVGALHSFLGKRPSTEQSLKQAQKNADDLIHTNMLNQAIDQFLY
ncbi:MAG: hypothetical protein ACSNEK_05225 [Parachlamydiaceae bacterium]